MRLTPSPFLPLPFLFPLPFLLSPSPLSPLPLSPSPPPLLPPLQLGSLTTSMTSKRYWLVLRKETPGGGRSRLEFYRSEEQSNEPVRVIPLDQIREVHHSERKKASFDVHLQDEVTQFSCSSKADTDDWMRDIARFQGGRGLTSSFNGELPDNTVNGQALYEGTESLVQALHTV